MNYRYTAILALGSSTIIKSYANDLNKLILHTMMLIDLHVDCLLGTIKDNETGAIIHRCKKVTRH